MDQENQSESLDMTKVQLIVQGFNQLQAENEELRLQLSKSEKSSNISFQRAEELELQNRQLTEQLQQGRRDQLAQYEQMKRNNEQIVAQLEEKHRFALSFEKEKWELEFTNLQKQISQFNLEVEKIRRNFEKKNTELYETIVQVEREKQELMERNISLLEELNQSRLKEQQYQAQKQSQSSLHGASGTPSEAMERRKNIHQQKSGPSRSVSRSSKCKRHSSHSCCRHRNNSRMPNDQNLNDNHESQNNGKTYTEDEEFQSDQNYCRHQNKQFENSQLNGRYDGAESDSMPNKKGKNQQPSAFANKELTMSQLKIGGKPQLNLEGIQSAIHQQEEDAPLSSKRNRCSNDDGGSGVAATAATPQNVRDNGIENQKKFLIEAMRRFLSQSSPKRQPSSNNSRNKDPRSFFDSICTNTTATGHQELVAIQNGLNGAQQLHSERMMTITSSGVHQRHRDVILKVSNILPTSPNGHIHYQNFVTQQSGNDSEQTNILKNSMSNEQLPKNGQGRQGIQKKVPPLMMAKAIASQTAGAVVHTPRGNQHSQQQQYATAGLSPDISNKKNYGMKRDNSQENLFSPGRLTSTRAAVAGCISAQPLTFKKYSGANNHNTSSGTSIGNGHQQQSSKKKSVGRKPVQERKKIQSVYSSAANKSAALVNKNQDYMLE